MKFLSKSDIKKLPAEQRGKIHHIKKSNINAQFFLKFFPQYQPANYEDFENVIYIDFETEAEKAQYKQDYDKLYALIEAYNGLGVAGAPASVFEEIKKWDIINKSPFSASFYNSYDIDWGSKPEGSLRISDHWNFESKGETHCVLEGTKEYLENTWILARYENGIYKELMRF